MNDYHKMTLDKYDFLTTSIENILKNNTKQFKVRRSDILEVLFLVLLLCINTQFRIVYLDNTGSHVVTVRLNGLLFIITT